MISLSRRLHFTHLLSLACGSVVLGPSTNAYGRSLSERSAGVAAALLIASRCLRSSACRCAAAARKIGLRSFRCRSISLFECIVLLASTSLPLIYCWRLFVARACRFLFCLLASLVLACCCCRLLRPVVFSCVVCVAAVACSLLTLLFSLLCALALPLFCWPLMCMCVK